MCCVCRLWLLSLHTVASYSYIWGTPVQAWLSITQMWVKLGGFCYGTEGLLLRWGNDILKQTAQPWSRRETVLPSAPKGTKLSAEFALGWHCSQQPHQRHSWHLASVCPSGIKCPWLPKRRLTLVPSLPCGWESLPGLSSLIGAGKFKAITQMMGCAAVLAEAVGQTLFREAVKNWVC